MVMSTKKFFLYLLIASVAVSALFGIGVLILGDFGEFETRVLLTALIVTTTSILGLACGASLDAREGFVIPIAGVVTAIISAALWMIMLWSRFDPSAEVFVHSVMSATLLAAACALVSLLSLADLDRRFAWARMIGYVAIWTLTAIILWILWADIDPSDSWLARTMGVISIIIGAVTVTTPIFHKLSSTERTVETIDAEIARLRAKIAELEILRNSADQAGKE